MEKRLSVKLLREEHHKTKEIPEKLIDHFGTESICCSEFCDWMREFARGREQGEDAR
jgi:hypothetical protein